MSADKPPESLRRVSVSGLFEMELVRQLNQDLKSGLSSLNFKVGKQRSSLKHLLSHLAKAEKDRLKFAQEVMKKVACMEEEIECLKGQVRTTETDLRKAQDEVQSLKEHNLKLQIKQYAPPSPLLLLSASPSLMMEPVPLHHEAAPLQIRQEAKMEQKMVRRRQRVKAEVKEVSFGAEIKKEGSAVKLNTRKSSTRRRGNRNNSSIIDFWELA